MGEAGSPEAAWRLARRQTDAALRALIEPDPDVASATTALRAAWEHLVTATGGVAPDGVGAQVAESNPAPSAPDNADAGKDAESSDESNAPESDGESSEAPAEEPAAGPDDDDSEAEASTARPEAEALARAWLRAHYGDDAHVEGGCLPWLFPGASSDVATPLPAELRSHAKWVRGRILEQAGRREGYAMAGLGLLLVMILLVASSLFLGDLQGGKEPWRVEYYSTETFKGEAKVEHTEKLDFDWGKSEPLRGVPKDEFSIRFTTCMTVDEELDVSFDLTSDDGSRLFVDGTQLIDNWGPHGTKSKKGRIKLESGVHLLEVEYFDRRYGAKVSLEMKGPDDDKYKQISLDLIEAPADGDDPCELGDE